MLPLPLPPHANGLDWRTRPNKKDKKKRASISPLSLSLPSPVVRSARFYFNLVLVALDEEGLVRGRLGAGHVLAQVGLGVRLRARLELVLRGLEVLGLALPRLEGGLLEGAAVREGERPADKIKRRGQRGERRSGQHARNPTQKSEKSSAEYESSPAKNMRERTVATLGRAPTTTRTRRTSEPNKGLHLASSHRGMLEHKNDRWHDPPPGNNHEKTNVTPRAPTQHNSNENVHEPTSLTRGPCAARRS